MLAAAAALALLAGCGADERRPDAADVRAAQQAVQYPLYWAGRDGRRLAADRHLAQRRQQ